MISFSSVDLLFILLFFILLILLCLLTLLFSLLIMIFLSAFIGIAALCQAIIAFFTSFIKFVNLLSQKPIQLVQYAFLLTISRIIKYEIKTIADFQEMDKCSIIKLFTKSRSSDLWLPHMTSYPLWNFHHIKIKLCFQGFCHFCANGKANQVCL